MPIILLDIILLIHIFHNNVIQMIIIQMINFFALIMFLSSLFQ